MAPTNKSSIGILVARRHAPTRRPQSAKADFAIFQERMHSLLAAARRESVWWMAGVVIGRDDPQSSDLIRALRVSA
jgi:hypothetical protein